MSKQAFGNKYKKTNGDSHVRLLRAWLQAAQICDEQMEFVISSVFRTLKSGAASKISAACGNDGGILSHDEDIYDCYKRLMSRYSDLARRYMETKHLITTAQTAAILNGIYSVVVSRLILSDENTVKQDNIVSPYSVNPIFLEKKEILSECVKSFSKSFDATAYRFHYENQSDFFRTVRESMIKGIDYNEALGLVGSFIETLCAFCISPFYQYYSQITKFAAMSLNDWDARKSLSRYVELLRQERQILDDIVRTQLPALTSLLQSSNVSDNEKGVIFSFVYSLNEANEHYINEMNSLSVFFKSENTKPYECCTEDFESFESEMNGLIQTEKQLSIQAFDEWKQAFSVKLTSLLNIAEEELSDMIKQGVLAISPDNYKYRFNRIIYETQLMAEDMCAAFISLNRYYSSNAELLSSCAHFDIIKGINETIEIKLEAISESKELFVDDVKKALSDFSLETPFESEEYESKAKPAAYDFAVKLCVLGKDDRNGLLNLRQNLTECANEALSEYEEKMNRSIAKYDELVNKKINKFKKEHLLYEMSTFDEIINYSVSRLRESSDSNVLDYVSKIDAETEELIKILQKNSVELIRPKPHDIFNGKEHEVLMAEVNPAFKKGEIIKLMNNGYRQGETVLMRANVIAAK